MRTDHHKHRPLHWGRQLAAAARRAGIFAAMTAGAFVVAGFILWDANFYVVRDKWEHFKLALFGEWQPNAGTGVRDVFDNLDSINLFHKSDVADVGVFVTGASYTSSADVMAGSANETWCYIESGGGAVLDRIKLGEQSGTDAPRFTDTNTIPAEVLTALGVSPAHLADLSRLHCRFSGMTAR